MKQNLPVRGDVMLGEQGLVHLPEVANSASLAVTSAGYEARGFLCRLADVIPESGPEDA